MDYLKEALTYQNQLNLLRKRGLCIPNEKKALNHLTHVSYYRLSSYFLPFQTEKDVFQANTTFDDIFDIYVLNFDYCF